MKWCSGEGPDMPENFVGEFTEHADDAWITANGARMVARAWTDPEYRTRMLASKMAPPGFAVAWYFATGLIRLPPVF